MKSIATGFYPARGAPTIPSGHAPNASPLQKHSIDDTVFPYVIIYRAPVSNAWFVRCPNGTTLPTPYATHQQAEQAIASAKQLDALVGKRVSLANREHTRAGTVQSIDYGVNATVAVRFDTDSYDTHLPPADLKVISTLNYAELNDSGSDTELIKRVNAAIEEAQ